MKGIVVIILDIYIALLFEVTPSTALHVHNYERKCARYNYTVLNILMVAIFYFSFDDRTL